MQASLDTRLRALFVCFNGFETIDEQNLRDFYFRLLEIKRQAMKPLSS
jgi:hypothetical protein